jgi:hypothetical protein
MCSAFVFAIGSNLNVKKKFSGVTPATCNSKGKDVQGLLYRSLKENENVERVREGEGGKERKGNYAVLSSHFSLCRPWKRALPAPITGVNPNLHVWQIEHVVCRPKAA